MRSIDAGPWRAALGPLVVAITSVAWQAGVAVAQTQGPGFTVSNGAGAQRQTLTLGAPPTDPTGAPPGMDYTVGGVDHGVQTWWWYRFPGDTREFVFNKQNSAWDISPDGSLATQVFALPNSIEARMSWSLSRSVAGGPIDLFGDLRLTTSGTTAQDITLFHYLDLDLGGTGNNDSAALVEAGGVKSMRVTDPRWRAAYFGSVNNGLASEAFNGLLQSLSDGGVTNLNPNGQGFPFGPGNWTGAYQYNVTVRPGITTELGVRVRIVPEPIALALFGIGCVGLLGISARRRRPV